MNIKSWNTSRPSRWVLEATPCYETKKKGDAIASGNSWNGYQTYMLKLSCQWSDLTCSASSSGPLPSSGGTPWRDRWGWRTRFPESASSSWSRWPRRRDSAEMFSVNNTLTQYAMISLRELLTNAVEVAFSWIRTIQVGRTISVCPLGTGSIWNQCQLLIEK